MMTTTSFARGIVQVPTATFAVAARPQRCINLVVRASGAEEETKISKDAAARGGFLQVDRSSESLFFPTGQSLSYLDGTAPADFGFDPLGLSDPEGAGGLLNPAWLSYAEVIHARWAMLGAAGILAPEILAGAGVIPQGVDQVLWWKTGLIPPLGVTEYWMDPFSLFFVEVVLMQFAELKRLQDFRHPGSQGKQYFLGLEAALGGSGDPAYPGGQFFNLFNLGKTDAAMKELKTKELKNGRLAMLAVFGFGAQAILTGVGPFQNLKDHLSNPVGANILANFK